jgi:hypothetical protein
MQNQRTGFDSRRYQIFCEVVGLQRGALSLVSTIEQLLGRNSSGSGLKIREYGSRDPLRWPHDTFYPQKLALTSSAIGGSSVGIVRSRTEATEFSLAQFRWAKFEEYPFSSTIALFAELKNISYKTCSHVYAPNQVAHILR